MIDESKKITIGELKQIFYGKIDWIRVFKDAYESRRTSWHTMGNIQEWRNATDEILFAVWRQLEECLEPSEDAPEKIAFLGKDPGQRKSTNDVCEHTWVYDNKILTSMPPQRKRICKKCGEIVTDRFGSVYPIVDNFNEICGEFSKKSKSETNHSPHGLGVTKT